MLLTVLTAGMALLQTVNFDQSTALPDGWLSGVTGRGAAKWEVVADRAAASSPNVLRQSGEATFCWAVSTKHKFKDGFAEVKIRPIGGKEDQAGGLVWRFKDANNYYVVRANALEGNVVLYKTVNGKRSSLQVKGRMFGYGVDTSVPKGKWSVLRVEFADTLFTVFYEGKQLFQVEDDTFQNEGTVGVWTKADSITLFDDFSYGSK
ncbi:MAG: hypothetical protein ACREXP_04045 [Steroidobacteraceae bacterium]